MATTAKPTNIKVLLRCTGWFSSNCPSFKMESVGICALCPFLIELTPKRTCAAESRIPEI